MASNALTLVGRMLLAAAILVPSALVIAPRAHAAKEAGGLAALKEARAKKDEDAVMAALDALVEEHNGTEDKKLKGKIQAALGGCLKEKKLLGARRRAASALGKLDDPKGAYKQLKKAIPSAKTPGTDPMAATVLRALGELKHDDAVGPMLKLLGATQEPLIAKETAEALGKFGDTKGAQKAAEGLCQALERYRADYDKAEKNAKKPDQKLAAQAMWVRNGPVVAEALNGVTGSSRADADAWLQAWKDAKGKVSKLFPEK